MSEHYIEICTNCGYVIGQCRCADKDKDIRYSLCDKCKRELPDGEYFKTVFQKLPLSEMIELTWGELNKSRFDAKLNAVFAAGYAAGLVHQARVDREAIEKVDDGELYRQILDDCGKCGNIEGPCNMPECAHFTVMLIHAIDVDKMIAALAAVAPEVK